MKPGRLALALPLGGVILLIAFSALTGWSRLPLLLTAPTLLALRWRRAGLILLGLLLLLEQGARVHLIGAASLSYSKIHSLQPLGVDLYFQRSRLPGVVYEFKPDAVGSAFMAPFRTNSAGLVDGEYASRKPPGVYRVAMLGGSFVQGLGVAPGEAFHAVMERQLAARAGGSRVEFINFGVGGFDPSQALATLEQRALAYDPDLVLFCFPMKEFRSPGWYRTPFTLQSQQYPFFDSFLVEGVVRLLSGEDNPMEPDEEVISPKESARRLEGVFKRLAQVNASGKTRVVVPILVEAFTFGDGLVRKLIADNGLRALVLAPPLKERLLDEELTIMRGDEHPDARGHALLADALIKELQRMGLLGEQAPASAR